MGIKEARKRGAAFLTMTKQAALSGSNNFDFSPFNPVHEAE